MGHNSIMNDQLSCELTTTAIHSVFGRLIKLHGDICHQAAQRLAKSACYFPDGQHPPSAINLAHYLAIRSFELRDLQQQLSALGLSSLGRGEAGIIDNLNRVISLLCCVLGEPAPQTLNCDGLLSNTAGAELLRHNSAALFGAATEGREVRIMVTLPSSAADDYPLIKELLEDGMNCARINCAHDSQDVWQRMVENVRKAEQETGKVCRIMMDLAGQKIRTGMIESGPAVHHLKVKRDAFGEVVSPGYLQVAKLSQMQDAPVGSHFQVYIDDHAHDKLTAGDRLSLIDHRGKHRHFDVLERNAGGVVLLRSWQSTYLSDNCVFQLRNKGRNKPSKHLVDIPVRHVQSVAAKIRVFKDEQLLLTGPDVDGRPAQLDDRGGVQQPAQIGISHQQVIKALHIGDSVWVDDGKIGAMVEALTEQGALLRITHVRAKGALIRSGKGVNFPDTELTLPALTEKDLQDLDFVCQHADILGYSFVQSKEDIDRLMGELQQRDAVELPVIAKIETQKAVKNLPEIILSSMGRTRLGVMIARGDLAVELGSVRMAEIQEEILWLCEAAHVPVVWATQVLETLAKQGVQSRPEITDAAMSVRAECVMLNKGPCIGEAVTVLNEILQRMQQHQHKKTSQLRALLQWPLAH